MQYNANCNEGYTQLEEGAEAGRSIILMYALSPTQSKRRL